MTQLTPITVDRWVYSKPKIKNATQNPIAVGAEALAFPLLILARTRQRYAGWLVGERAGRHGIWRKLPEADFVATRCPAVWCVGIHGH